MANYEINHHGRMRGFGSTCIGHIKSEVAGLRSKLTKFYVPEFPLDRERIQELMNAPGALEHICALIDLKYTCFTTVSSITVVFDNVSATRGVIAALSMESIILPNRPPTMIKSWDWSTATSSALRIPTERITMAEFDALQDWTNKAQEWRRKCQLISRTVGAFTNAATCTYNYSATWPALSLVASWGKDYGDWPARFEDKPRSPQNYDLRVIGNIPDLAKRIEACDFLFVKAKLMPDRERTGDVRAAAHQWEPHPNDPEWMK